MADNNSRIYPLDKIRNIGIIAHIDAGKTTTSERILYYTGKSYKIGDIDEGTTVMDWMDKERERGITIVSAATTTYWTHSELGRSKGQEEPYRINLIDTPGHVDFTAEVERSLRVLDGAVTVLDAEEGVQSQSETVWRQADKYNVPRICFINKMDRVGVDYAAGIESLKKRLGAKVAVLHLPIGSESGFKGIIDLVAMKAYIWHSEDLGSTYDEVDIPAEYKENTLLYRKKLLEIIAEEDDTLMEKFFEKGDLSEDEIKTALRKSTIAN